MDGSVLLYDADCAFCTRAARFGRRLGLRARIVPLRSVDLPDFGVDAGRALREIPFIDPYGTVTYGADAIADALGTGNMAWRSTSWILRSWPIRDAARGVYRVIARHRRLLPGGTAACAIPKEHDAPLG